MLLSRRRLKRIHQDQTPAGLHAFRRRVRGSMQFAHLVEEMYADDEERVHRFCGTVLSGHCASLDCGERHQ